jgi:6,7-dimethyl-8-ribityllumazine synthase
MESLRKDPTIKGLAPKSVKVSGNGLRILIIHTRWNWEIVGRLVDGCVETLVDLGVEKENIVIRDVPGAFELPFAAKKLTASGNFDACIPIGVLIKGSSTSDLGSTMHFEYIADAVSNGLMNVGLLGTPVIFGVLTCLTEEQALERSGFGN